MQVQKTGMLLANYITLTQISWIDFGLAIPVESQCLSDQINNLKIYRINARRGVVLGLRQKNDPQW